jgi:hypothetical protein
LAYHLSSGPDHAQYPAVRRYPGQVRLLDAAKGLGRSGIAGEYHQGTALLEKPLYALQRIVIDGLERSVAIWRPGIIAQVDIIILRQPVHHFFQYGQSAITRIEYTDGLSLYNRHDIKIKKKRQDGVLAPIIFPGRVIVQSSIPKSLFDTQPSI